MGTVVEADSRPTSPPKGESEMSVGVEPSFSEVVAETVEAPRLPNRTLIIDERVPTEAVVLSRPAVEVEEVSKPVNTAVILFPMMVVDDSDPYPGGTPAEGPLGYGNLVT